jgi:2-polyprenyl-3-methyl-5-hydroxy-6-metoxy-1,4-benzoquinol methylase
MGMGATLSCQNVWLWCILGAAGHNGNAKGCRKRLGGAMERILTELRFHEQQAQQRAAAGVAYQFSDADYLDHETWIRPAFAQLGNVRGLHVLDLGCGHGMASVVLARAGARVTAIDISGGYLEEAKARAKANGLNINFVQANAEELPFVDALFDRVWGCAILHHLDLGRAGATLQRVLCPGGRAVFSEPWGGNPLLSFARQQLPYPGKHRTPDEMPLTLSHIQQLKAMFPGVQLRGFQLLSMACRFVNGQRLKQRLDWCDTMLLERVPALENYCRYVVLTLQAGQ